MNDDLFVGLALMVWGPALTVLGLVSLPLVARLFQGGR